jgi:hypothetical protein
VRDNGCVWCGCDNFACELIPLEPAFPGESSYADMGGTFGACPPDGQVNIHDRTHALLCFEGATTCDTLNIDGGGAFGACPPDGFCNIHDVNHVLRVFGGINPCTCPPGPAPEMPTPSGGSASVRLVTANDVVRPGTQIAVDVVLEDIVALQSYQLHAGVTGGLRGALELVDIFIDPKRAMFADAAAFQAFNVKRGQMLAGTEPGQRDEHVGLYLATFVYMASVDARGDFVIDLRHGGPEGQTYLIAPDGGPVGTDQIEPVIVRAASQRRR